MPSAAVETVETSAKTINHPPSDAFKTCFDLLFTLIDLDITLLRLVVLASIASSSSYRVSDEQTRLDLPLQSMSSSLAVAISGHQFYYRGFVRGVISDEGLVGTVVGERDRPREMEMAHPTGQMPVGGIKWECHCPINSSQIREAQLEGICSRFQEWLESLSERLDPTSAESVQVDESLGIRRRGGVGGEGALSSQVRHEGEVVDERKKRIWQKVKVEMSHAYNIAKSMIRSASTTSPRTESPQVDSSLLPPTETYVQQVATGQIDKEWREDTNVFNMTKDMLGHLIKSARAIADHKLKERLYAGHERDVVDDLFGSWTHTSKPADDGPKLHLVTFSVDAPIESKTSRSHTTVPDPISAKGMGGAGHDSGGRHKEGIPVEPIEPRDKVVLWAMIGSGRCLPKSTTSSNTTLLFSSSRTTSHLSHPHLHSQVRIDSPSKAVVNAEITSFAVLPRFNRSSGPTANMSAWYPDIIASLVLSNVGTDRGRQSEAEGDAGSTVLREIVPVICGKLLEYELQAARASAI